MNYVWGVLFLERSRFVEVREGVSSDVERIIWFDPNQVYLEEENLYQFTMIINGLHLQSAGAITVNMKRWRSGQITVTKNPMIVSDLSLKEAVETLVKSIVSYADAGI